MTMLNFSAEKLRIRAMRERGFGRRFGGNHNANKTHCVSGHELAGNNVALRFRVRDGLAWIERRCVECRNRQRHSVKTKR